MGLKGFFKMLFKGGSEIKALKAENAALRSELGAVKNAKLSGKEAAVLEEGLNGGAKAASVGDGFQAAAQKGVAGSTMRSGHSYLIEGIQSGQTLKAGSVYRTTTNDVIKIGETELNLSDPRIIKALESKGIGGEIVIGRSSSCDVVLKDGFVSGEHLIIRQKCPGSKRLYIEDLSSSNGTTIIKANKYTKADRAADAAKGEEYIESLGRKESAAKDAVSSNPAVSKGKGTVEVPYDSKCRMIYQEIKPGTKLSPAADYFTGANSKLRIGGEEINLSDPIIAKALKNKGSITIGRSSDCDIVINNNMVSRTHLQITRFDDGKFLIRDLGSKNGTQFIQ